MIGRKIRVLVVEEGNPAQRVLPALLGLDGQLLVAGVARNGVEAIEFLSRQTADVVLMDIRPPESDGLEATRRIMETRPLPVVICSAVSRVRESIAAIRLIEAGAVACVKRPPGSDQDGYGRMAADLVQTVKLMSEVKVVRRWPRFRSGGVAGAAPAGSATRLRPRSRIEVIGIGASTGGPPVLQTILTQLPANFSVPILIVQHIAPGFIQGMADWLAQSTGREVHLAAQGDVPRAGHAYLAPDHFHMGLHPGGFIHLEREGLYNSMRPSVSYLFRSLAAGFSGCSVGVLLTGMGKDGAEELKSMRDRGSVTIAQDQETSVVFGMPGEAVALGAAIHVLPAGRIADALEAIASDIPFSEGRV